MEGYTDNYIRVTMPFDPDLVNKIVPVELEKINGDGHLEGSYRRPGISTFNHSTSNHLQPAV